MRQPVEQQIKRSGQGDDQKRREVAADRRLRESMNGVDHAAASQECAEDGHDISHDHQDNIPNLQHAFLFLNHDRMQEGSSDQPRHQRCILHRIPRPEAAPAQLVIRPLAAEQNPDAQEHPGNHRPSACRANPGIAELLRNQRSHRKCKRHSKADEAEIKHGRVDHHVRVLQ